MANRIHLFQLLDYLMKLNFTTNDPMPDKNKEDIILREE